MSDSASAEDFEITVTGPVDHVSTVTFSRPPHNFFSYELVDRLATTIERLGHDPAARAVVLRSDGKHFCAGADFSPKVGGTDRLSRPNFEPHVYDAAIRLVQQPVPVVAAVQGRAVGGGLGLAMVCDFRVAEPGATFAAPFAKLGIHHGFGLSVTLPDAIGEQAARRLLYRGGSLSGVAAHELGLCDELVPADQLRSATQLFAAELAAAAPLALRAIRQTMRADLVEGFVTAVRRERALQSLLGGTDDAAEGILAARERRAAHFQGT